MLSYGQMRLANFPVVTARKRSSGQGNLFTGVCLSTEGVGFPACITGHMTSIWGGGGGWLPSMHHRSYDQHPEGQGLASPHASQVTHRSHDQHPG